MTIQSGTRLGPYEILSAIGAGGMGEVWKARDTRLDRVVAIKTVHGIFSERFEREARAISALNHPHICTLYDIGEHEGAGYLVMEYVEGTPLTGPLPVDRALKNAAQICDALDAAHRKGIVHRDLKPDNILVTRAGVKLLDFGLAKALEPAATGQADSPSAIRREADAAVTQALTGAHVVLGTPQYMAPEQIEGRDVDTRTDIFAFGCVLYELLTGKKAFDGKTPSSTMAAILATEPRPMRELRPVTPASVERIVTRCLAKDPDNRWQSARDLKAEIEWIAAGGASSVRAAETSRATVPPWALASVLTVALAIVIWAPWRAGPTSPDLMRFQMGLTGVEGNTSIALSPDGRSLAYAAAADDGRNVLWIRLLSSLQDRRLAGTEGVVGGTFWSPDSRFLAFGVDGKLKTIDVSGGPPQTIADAPSPRGGAWNKGGMIVIGTATGLLRVSLLDGTITQLTKVDPARNEVDHFRPDFLPDGRHFVYLRTTRDARNATVSNGAVFLGSLDTRPDDQPSNPVLTAQGGARASVQYVPASASGPGYLVFLRDGTLIAQRFDPGRLELTGEAIPISDTPGTITSYFSASQNGIIVYRTVASLLSRMMWFDRSGSELGPLGKAAVQFEFNLSPDGERVAVQRSEAGNPDIWIFDVERGSSTRLTTDPGADLQPVWSAKGDEVVFSSGRNGRLDLFTKASSGAGDDRLLLESHAYPQDWSRDGRSLLYVTTPGSGAKTAPDLWTLPMDGDRKPIPYVATPFTEVHGNFSPDGRWVAYTSDESGRREIYVQPFPDPSKGKWIVSVGGGTQPRWRRDGKELFYIAPDDKLMAVDVVNATTGPTTTFLAGIPKPLFTAPKLPTGGVTNWGEAWDTAPDGQRFLFHTRSQEKEQEPVSVVLNWQAGLKK